MSRSPLPDGRGSFLHRAARAACDCPGRQAQGERQDGALANDDQSARQQRQRERSLALMTLTAVMLGFAAYVVWRENHPAIRMSWDGSWIVWSINPMVEATGLNRWMLPISVAGRYVGLLVAPVQLSLDYGGHVLGPAARWSDPYVWIGAAALVGAVTGTALALRKRRYDLLLLWVGLGLSYGLVSNFVLMIGTIMGERLMYLPSAFFVMLVGYALRRLPRRGLWVAMSLLLALGGWRTVSYAAMWNHPIDLYRSLMRQHPESARGYRLVAQELFYAGQSKEAWEILERGLERVPDDVDFWLYAVRAALAEHDPAHALRLLDRAEQQERLRQRRLGIERRTSLEELDNWRDRAQRMLNEEGALKYDPLITSVFI